MINKSVIKAALVVIGLIKSNATVIIKDRAFIEMMKNLFRDAYKDAEEIK
jgi:hypothetical protein